MNQIEFIGIAGVVKPHQLKFYVINLEKIKRKFFILINFYLSQKTKFLDIF